MSLLALEQFGFTYEGSTQPALAGIDLTVEEGQWLLLCGPTGSGKSTLLRALKPLVAPAGRQSGTLYYDGVPMDLLSAERQAQEIGLVLQKGEEQMVMEVVWQELAFPLENLAVPQAEMRARIAELASFFGLTPLLEERLLALSGGQKQIINLASVLMMRPRVLLLDEPLAQLDPVMVRDFVQFLQTLHDELGLTIIIAEHHLEPLLPLVQRVLVLEDGHLAVDGSAAEACRYFAQRANLTDYIPDLVRLYTRTAETETAALPLSVREAKCWAAARQWQAKPHARRTGGDVVLAAREVYFRYDRSTDDVLKGLDCTLRKGQITAILGGNGSGKSTLLKVLFGALPPQRGRIMLNGRPLRRLSTAQLAAEIGYLAQDPAAYFLCTSVAEEIRRHDERLGSARDEAWLQWLRTLFLEEAWQTRHPYDLSGGQQQRLALYLVLSRRPQVLLLDEPTRGLDPVGRHALAQVLAALCQQGLAIVLVTHDLEFAAAYADVCGMLFQGELSELVSAPTFFAGNHFYTTAVNKVFGAWLPEAVTAEDVEEVPHA